MSSIAELERQAIADKWRGMLQALPRTEHSDAQVVREDVMSDTGWTLTQLQTDNAMIWQYGDEELWMSPRAFEIQPDDIAPLVASWMRERVVAHRMAEEHAAHMTEMRAKREAWQREFGYEGTLDDYRSELGWDEFEYRVNDRTFYVRLMHNWNRYRTYISSTIEVYELVRVPVSVRGIPPRARWPEEDVKLDRFWHRILRPIDRLVKRQAEDRD